MTATWLIISGVLLSTALGLTACAGPAAGPGTSTAPGAGDSPQPGAASDKPFVIGSLEEPASLSALVDLPHHFPEHVPQTLLFDSLLQYMPDGSVAPKLAEKWQMGVDGVTFTYNLSGTAKFHDGQSVTAEDVKFTFDTLLDPASKSSNEGVATVSKTEVVDPHTVKVTLKGPNPRFLAEGGARGIVPRHVLQGKDIAADSFNKNTIGSGPYKLASYQPGQSISLEAVPDFYRGAANLKRVIFKIIPEQNVLLTQLRAGELQYALLAARDLAAVQNIQGVKVVENKTPRYFSINPNFDRPFFADQRVREAIETAIDRKGIVDKVLLGHGEVVESGMVSSSWAFNPDVPKHPYDLARAKSLLDEAGWRTGSDGVREKDGIKLKFGVMINSYDRTLEQALVVAQQSLKDAGVAMDIQRVEPGVFGARRSKKDYDALSRVWNPVYDPDRASSLKGSFWGYSNPRVDELATLIATSYDREARKRAMQEVQEISGREIAEIFLYSENELHAVPANLSGYQTHPVNFFWNIKDWKLAN